MESRGFIGLASMAPEERHFMRIPGHADSELRSSVGWISAAHPPEAVGEAVDALRLTDQRECRATLQGCTTEKSEASKNNIDDGLKSARQPSIKSYTAR